MSRAKLDESRTSNFKEPQNYWGFANFPNQVFRRAIKNGFDFTLMVVGRSGLGKSTFINTLFLAEINDVSDYAPELPASTVRIEEKHVKLVENSVTLNLTLVDTPGFGDAVNNSKCWDPIIKYVESKYLEFFSEEIRIERSEKWVDKCVHLCLYFIEPSGHGLKPIDIEFMKQLSGLINIVPVIAKADCLTKEELLRFKAQINKDIEANSIKLYKFPDGDEDNEKITHDLRNKLPFAIVGSNMIKDKDGKRVRYREYPWGVVEVENMAHNDFIALRDLIVRTNLIDMIDVTRSVHYENYRYRQMEKLPKNSGDRDPFTQMEEERRNKEKELTEKKTNMDKLFDEKVRERENNIQKRKNDMLNFEKEQQQCLASKKQELERLKTEVEDLRRGSSSDSKVSLQGSNENANRTSPDKTKKRIATLGLWNRN
ncbi:unnamed protein product [Auanema sp. JU1783]|nr:unnamed protein product [Auanema sp. JU1783]